MMLPFAKLGTLFLKTLSKPFANRLKHHAAHHPRFRTLIVDFAQAHHRFITTLQRRLYGHSTEVAIRPLNEEKAVQAATDLLGEFFLFSVAGAAVIFEVQRSARSEARKEEARKKELEDLREKNSELEHELVLLKEKVEEIEKLARGRGLSGIFSLQSAGAADGKVKKS